MSVTTKALELVKRYGAPVKFAAKMILGTVVPGSPYIVELVEKVFDCAQGAARDNLDGRASAADLERVEQMLDLLQGDLQALVAKLCRLEAVPDVAKEILRLALKTDEACRRSARQLETLATQFDLFAQQLLHGQVEDRKLLQRIVGVSDFVEELIAAGCTPQVFGQLLERFEEALNLLSRQKPMEAEALFRQQSVEQPRSAALAVALAASQTVAHRFVDAEQSLKRAVRLKPGDAGLVELHQRATALSRRGETPAPAGSSSLLVKEGDVLDGWVLQKLLGRGGWGQVYRVEKAGRVAALKIMHPELARDPAFVDRFKREIKTLHRLDAHANLIAIDDYGCYRDCWYFTMPFFDGGSLERYLERKGPLPAGQARKVFKEVAAGLAAAHARGIVHRDIKPDLLTQTDRPETSQYHAASRHARRGRRRFRRRRYTVVSDMSAEQMGKARDEDVLNFLKVMVQRQRDRLHTPFQSSMSEAAHAFGQFDGGERLRRERPGLTCTAHAPNAD